MIYLIAHLIFNGNSYGEYRVKESMSLIAARPLTLEVQKLTKVAQGTGW